MNRQTFLRANALSLASLAGNLAFTGRSWAAAADPASQHRLGTAWRRVAAGSNTAQDFVGVLALDLDKRTLQVQTEHVVSSRAHGVLAEPSGGFLVLAARPGTWMRRIDAAGQVAQHLDVSAEKTNRTLDGHVMASADGKWLYTPETDRSTGEGWVSVRDTRTLAIQTQWRAQGRDPHQCLIDASGALMLLNGGILRKPDGSKRDLDQMNSSLVRLDGRTGELLGQWRLDDKRLSLRHMAWSLGGSGNNKLLGIALQAEHDDAVQRRDAPVLAVWDGNKLTIPSREMTAGGYGGDIAAGPGGGFVVSGQRVGKGVLWHPEAPEKLFAIAELKDLCALASAADTVQGGVLIGSERGVALWHPRSASAMLPWPQAMTLDNHWVVLS